LHKISRFGGGHTSSYLICASSCGMMHDGMVEIREI
jgi:hypothetical protein